MKTFPRRLVALLLLIVFVTAGAAGCSRKGVHMPKHRKRRHCDCPTFSYSAPLPACPAAAGTLFVADNAADV